MGDKEIKWPWGDFTAPSRYSYYQTNLDLHTSKNVVLFLSVSSEMARFFKYRSLQALQEAATSQGVALSGTDQFSPLFEPITIGHRVAGNRLAIHPMEGCDSTKDGLPDDLTYRRWERFGAGGAKIIWGEATAVVEEGRANPRQLWIHEQSCSALEKLLKHCRAAHRTKHRTDSDLMVGLQLTHSGRYAYRNPSRVFCDPLLDPRTKAATSRPLITDDQLKKLEDHYVVAATRAFQLGFDFIDIKQCHRYLLSELLAAKTRPGIYGGSLENRTRFIGNVIRRIRDAVPQAIICSRINAYDGPPFSVSSEIKTGTPERYSLPFRSGFGTCETDPLQEDLNEPRQLLGILQSLDVPMISISMGNPYSNPHIVRPYEYPPVDGYETPEHPVLGVDRHFRIAAQLQRAYPQLVLVGSGYSWLQSYLPHVAAAQIKNGNISVVGIGRASLAYPDLANAVLEQGVLEPRQVCRTFSYCTALMRAKHNDKGQFPTGCPPFDKEIYGPIWKDASDNTASH